MKNAFTLIFLATFVFSAKAQDPLFTQKTGNINHFNPALVGTQSDFGVQINYRNQWPTLSGSYINSSMLVNYNFKNGLGVGLESGRENSGEGLLMDDKLKANVSYKIDFNKIETRYGLNLGYGQRSIDVNRLRFEDTINPSQGFVNPTNEQFESETKNYLTIDIGAAAYYNGLMAGFGIQQLNQPNVSLAGEPNSIYPIRFVGKIGYMKEFDKLAVAGMFTFQNQDVFSVLETQTYCQYKFIKLGVGHRQTFGEFANGDYFSAMVGVQFDKFSVGYSYDDTPFNTSRASFGGIHQATAAWYIKGLNNEKGMNKFMNLIM